MKNKTITITCFFIALLISILLYSKSLLKINKKYYNENENISNKINSIENINIINQRLNALTINISKGITNDNRNIPYTLVHQFYIPLLYGAKKKNITLKRSFDNLITFNIVNEIKQSNILNVLDKKVFYFLAAEYLRSYGISSSDNQKVFDLIKNETFNYWNVSSGKVWSAEKNNFKGVRARVSFILTGKDNGNMSYYSAITDHDLFVMGTGVSLALTEKNAKGKISPELDDISEVFINVLNKLVVFNVDGTWLLQPNIWKDHRDYKDLSSSELISWDTSHFSRFPAYLNLLDMYTNKNTEQNNLIKKLKSGLAKQFVSKVALYDKSTKIYSFTNYVDGDNKSYRVGYKTNPKGYGPSQNYVHVFYCWWKLLDDSAINFIYQNIESNFSFYENNNPQIKRLGDFYKEVVNLD